MADHYTWELTTPSFFYWLLGIFIAVFVLFASLCIWVCMGIFLFLWQLGMMAKYIYFYICKVLKFCVCFPLYIIIGTKEHSSCSHCFVLEYSLLESSHSKLLDKKHDLPPCYLFLMNCLDFVHRDVSISGSTLTKQRICFISKGTA